MYTCAYVYTYTEPIIITCTYAIYVETIRVTTIVINITAIAIVAVMISIIIITRIINIIC